MFAGFVRRRWHLLTLLVVSSFGMALIAVSTRFGPGIGGDATIYITCARNWLAGYGIGLLGPEGDFRLIPYFPPFFSLVLGGLGALGLDMVSSARWLNIVLFGAIIWLTGCSMRWAARSSFLALLAALLVAVSPVLIPVYSWAMSEPLSIFLGFSGLALLALYFERLSQRRLLWIAGLACGLSFLTRYSAAAFIAAGALGVLILPPVNWRRRLTDAVLFGCAGVLFMAVWLAYDYWHTTTVASRSVLTLIQMAGRVDQLVRPLGEVFLFWIVPDSWVSAPPYPALLNWLALVLCGLGMVLWTVWEVRRIRVQQTPDDNRLLHLGGLSFFFCLAYLGLTALVYLTTYPPITIGYRMYSPLHIAFLWWLVALVGISLQRVTARRAGYVMSLVLVLVMGWYSWRSMRIVAQNYREGMGYLSPVWQNSPTLQAVRALPVEQPLVTNEEMALLFLTGRTTYPLAEIYYDRPLDQFDRYGRDNAHADKAQQVFRQGAVLVLFDSINAQLGGLYGERTTERVAALTRGLQQAFKGDDGGIYYDSSH